MLHSVIDEDNSVNANEILIFTNNTILHNFYKQHNFTTIQTTKNNVTALCGSVNEERLRHLKSERLLKRETERLNDEDKLRDIWSQVQSTIDSLSLTFEERLLRFFSGLLRQTFILNVTTPFR